MNINFNFSRIAANCFILVLALHGCQVKERKIVSWEVIDTPVLLNSEQPFLLGNEGNLHMLWTETVPESKVALLRSTYSKGQWADRNEVARGEDWFVNWADFPALSKSGKNMITHYLKKSDTATFSYDIRFLHSSSNGDLWSQPVKMHSDTMKAEHGFVSFSPFGKGSFRAVWLDGRNMAGGHHAMQLRSAEIGADGKIVSEEMVDDRTCDCCQTSLVQTDQGTLVAYRDRTDDEIRDIYVSLLRNGKWSAPKAVFNDGWKINGCPVNGPKLSVFETSTGLAWFTGAGDRPRVKVAFSDDGGLNFGDPWIVDEGSPLGRVDLFMVDENTALLSWMEMNQQDAELRLALIDKMKGKLTSLIVAELSSARSTGFPQLEVAGGEVFLAWNEETAEGKRIKLVKTDLERIYP
jgi:hypothetical protein